MSRGREPGSPKVGGRKKGTPNKATAALQQAVIAQIKSASEGDGKVAPLQHMLNVLNSPRPDDETLLPTWERNRMAAAIAAAPYIHPRLQAQLNEDGNTSVEESVKAATDNRLEQLRVKMVNSVD